MRRSAKLFAAGVLALSAGSFSTDAQAIQKCYRLNPFVDYLKLEFDPVVNGHRNVYGNWVAPGSYTEVNGKKVPIFFIIIVSIIYYSGTSE